MEMVGGGAGDMEMVGGGAGDMEMVGAEQVIWRWWGRSR